MLGDHHYKMKTGLDGARQAFETERDRLHVKYSKVLSPTSVGDYGRHYTVTYEGQVVNVMEIWHVRNLARAYDPHRMCALYFFWDEEQKATVVFSGPEKLPTPADNT